jgi:hypothetical protein
MLWIFLIPEIFNLIFLEFKNNYLELLSFEIFLICLITSRFEIGNGKKKFQYPLNIHI